MVFEPGWRWSNDVKPIAGTESCEAPHLQYHVSGRLGIRMDDGAELTAGPGDITSLPSGHDAWVVGDEPLSSSTGSALATMRRAAESSVRNQWKIRRAAGEPPVAGPPGATKEEEHA